MTIVARKFVSSKSTVWITATLCELVTIAFLVGMVRNTPVLEFFWFMPFAAVIMFLVGPLVVWVGLSELRKNGVVMFFDRNGISWEWSGAFFLFWRPAKSHFHRIKWDEILGAKLGYRTIEEHRVPILLLGITGCESITPTELASRHEWVLKTQERPLWDRTLPIENQGEWLWNPQEVVAQIEQTLGDKSLREQWGEPPQFAAREMSAPA